MDVLLSYVRTYFADDGSPLAGEVKKTTREGVKLRNGVSLSCYPCRPQAVRGVRGLVAVADELAHFVSSDGYPRDKEMLTALRPTLATTGGKLIVLSSPHAQAGELYELHQKHYGNDDSPTLCWKADAPTMNPTLPADYLERMRTADPEAYRSEVLGEFRAGLSTLFDPDVLDRCVVEGRVELPPSDDVTQYRAFVDVSHGRSDDFALCVGHQKDDGTIVIDALRWWSSPFDPAEVTKECSKLMKRYGTLTAKADRVAGEWATQQFRLNGIDLDQTAIPKSDLYLAALAKVNARQVELPDVPSSCVSYAA